MLRVSGIDGIKLNENKKTFHGFEGEKDAPRWYKGFGGDLQNSLFDVYWKYLEELSWKYAQ